MTVPDYQKMMLPLLQLAADGEEHRLRDAIEELGDHFGLGDDERKELLPAGLNSKTVSMTLCSPSAVKA